MTEDDQADHQKTPKGYEVPIPDRESVIRDLMKAAPRVRPDAETAKDEDRSAPEPDASTPKP